ncbi:MAG: hypothetical protein DRI34_14500, partial [Deltaproteobacteria bacterium]
LCEDGSCAECCSDTDCGDGTCNAGVCQCPSGQEMKCAAGQMCVECCATSDCDDSVCPGQVSCDNGTCEALGFAQGEDCSKDATACCSGLSCDVFTNTCQPECDGDAFCQALDMPFAGDLKCSNGVCDFDHCLKDTNCSPGMVCYNGDCVTIPSCDDIDSCQIVPAATVTQQGTAVQLAASAYFASGALAPGVTFEWASDDQTIAAVDVDGLVSGGASTGSATITATVAGGCSVSCTATVRNYGGVTQGSRVVVLSELEQTPIEGATVEAGGESVQTDANGVANLTADLSATAADVTIWHPQYHYLTMRGVGVNDVIAHLGKLYQFDFSSNPPKQVAGGIKGKFDFSRIPCEPGKACDVSFGLGGLSIPGNLVNLNFDLLIGGMINTEIDIGGKQIVPLPAGLVLCLNAQCFKENFTPTGIPGKRAAWGLGGKLDLSELIEILGPVITGGGDDIDIGPILVALLPMFANFYTAIEPNITVDPIDMIVDVNDINGNDETTDLVPDYDNFPAHDMTLKVKMDQTMTFNVGALPANPAGGYWYDGVIILAGVIAKDVGLIPLGISAGLDAETKEDTPDGQISPITINCADVAGRIPESQVQRVVVAMALNISALAGGGDQPFALAGLVIPVAEFTGTHTLDGFLLPPTSVTYDAGARSLTVSGVPAGTTYNQVIFDGEDGANWNVVGVFGDETFTLPAAPAAGDRAGSASFISIKLRDGLDYQGLLHFDEDNMGRLVELVDSFSFYEVP